MSLVSYIKQIWHDSPLTDTPITAARLDHIEQGIKDVTDEVISVEGQFGNAYQTTDSLYSSDLVDADELPVNISGTGKRRIKFSTFKNSVADAIWNWLVANKTTADKDISTEGQKLADAKGLYDLDGLISNINGNAVEWTSGTTTAGSYRTYNGNLWYCKANTSTAPSEGTYWTKVNNITLNNGLADKYHLKTYTWSNVTISANSTHSETIPLTDDGKNLITYVVSCWSGRIVSSSYEFGRLAWYNLQNYDVNNLTLRVTALYG